MQISYTEDGYLKVNVEKNEEIDYEQIQRMNTTPYLMPSLRDRYEDNSVLYYIGEYITIADFIKGKVFSFVDFQNLLVSLLQVYAKLEKDGYIFSNTCVSLDRIFIHPVKKTFYLIYVPIKGGLILPKERLSELLHELIFGIQTNDSAILLGILLEASNKDDISLDKLIADLKNVKEQNLDMQHHVVEKEIEVPVEKIIIKGGKCKTFGVIAMVTEALTGILLPVVIGMLAGTKMVNVQVCIALSVFNIIVYMISMIALNQNKMQLVDGNVMANAQEIRNGNEPNKNEMIEKQSSEKLQEIFNIKEENQRTYENNPARVKRKIGVESIRENSVSAQRGTSSQNKIENVKKPKNMVLPNDSANLHVKMIDLPREEGTAILYDDAFLSKAYIIEDEKNGLMDRIFIDKTEFIIGREYDVDFRITDNSVSKKHVKINEIQGIYYISDLQSSNGTFVNGKRVSKKIKLEDGNKIKIGNKIYVFHNK